MAPVTEHYLNRVIENSSVLAVAVDKQENLWISTLLKGVFVYLSTVFKKQFGTSPSEYK
jgi:YesN/AraC family two-component response regulator